MVGFGPIGPVVVGDLTAVWSSEVQRDEKSRGLKTPPDSARVSVLGIK